jgi:hypothetical protein
MQKQTVFYHLTLSQQIQWMMEQRLLREIKMQLKEPKEELEEGCHMGSRSDHPDCYVVH